MTERICRHEGVGRIPSRLPAPRPGKGFKRLYCLGMRYPSTTPGFAGPCATYNTPTPDGTSGA